MIHDLKTWPDQFEAIVRGTKHHEVRRVDRPFRVGDQLRLREFKPSSRHYTGRETQRVVTYISQPGTFGLPDNLCVLSIEAG